MRKDNPEGRLQLQIIHYLKAKGYKVGKTKTTGIRRGRVFCYDPYTYRGFPDLVCFTPNLYFIEVKAPKGVQSDEQREFQHTAEQAGTPYILARKLEDVSEVIK